MYHNHVDVKEIRNGVKGYNQYLKAHFYNRACVYQKKEIDINFINLIIRCLSLEMKKEIVTNEISILINNKTIDSSVILFTFGDEKQIPAYIISDGGNYDKADHYKMRGASIILSQKKEMIGIVISRGITDIATHNLHEYYSFCSAKYVIEKHWNNLEKIVWINDIYQNMGDDFLKSNHYGNYSYNCFSSVDSCYIYRVLIKGICDKILHSKSFFDTIDGKINRLPSIEICVPKLLKSEENKKKLYQKEEVKLTENKVVETTKDIILSELPIVFGDLKEINRIHLDKMVKINAGIPIFTNVSADTILVENSDVEFLATGQINASKLTLKNLPALISISKILNVQKLVIQDCPLFDWRNNIPNVDTIPEIVIKNKTI